MLTLFGVDARALGCNLKQQHVQGLRESTRPSIRRNLSAGSKNFVRGAWSSFIPSASELSSEMHYTIAPFTPQGCARVS